MLTHEVITGDCRDILALLPDNHCDSIVSDPPYGLHFMGKSWDKFANGARAELHQADMKIGAPLAAGKYDGRRDDEFQAFMRDVSVELLRVAKPGAYMLMFGSPRRHHRLACGIEDAGWEVQDCLMWLFGSGFPKHKSKLKPGYEPIILARKSTPRATPLQIDECRLDTGRWPANVVLDEVAASLLDAQTGILTSNSGKPFNRNTDKHRNTYSAFEGRPTEQGYYGDSGGASRFFYVAKASRSEREAGCAELPTAPGGANAKGFTDDVASGNDRNKPVHNHHPTVKPLALMQWLVRLVTPPSGLVLDPFTGSGTTGCAAALEGFGFLGYEQSDEFAAIARARITHWSGHGNAA